MNLYSVAIEILRRFVAHHRAPPVAKHRTYVFFLFPLAFSQNGDAKKVEVTQSLINGHSKFDRPTNYTPRAPLALGRGEICCAAETTPDGDVDSDPQLDYRLMWTWFLPNPLWKPKRRR